MKKKVRSVLCFGARSSDKNADGLRMNVSEVAATGLGASIPQELFFNILRWVSRNDTRRETEKRLQRELEHLRDRKKSAAEILYKEDEEMRKASPIYTLRSCSLVCVYWANQCREYMFRGAHLNVWSLQTAQYFRKYSTDGCKNLVPICTLIQSIDVWVFCHRTQRSFVDLVYLPHMRGKLDTLKIFGPLPEGLSPAKLDTPHWSLTNLATPPPPATAYQHVVLIAIDFPSFRHLVKYFKFLDSAVSYHLANITWSDKAPSTPSCFFKPLARHRKSFSVNVSRCTDDLILCIQVAMMYPDFPLRAVSSQDEAVMLHLLNIVGEFWRSAPQTADKDTALKCIMTCRKYNLAVCIPLCVMTLLTIPQGSEDDRGDTDYYVSLVALQAPVNYVDVSLQFFGEDKPSPYSSIESGRTPHIRRRIAGIVVSIGVPTDVRVDDYSKLVTVDLTPIENLIQQHHSPLAMIISFADYGVLELFVSRYPTLLARDEDTVRTPIFMCHCSAEYPVPEGTSEGTITQGWAQVDDTMKSTGAC